MNAIQVERRDVYGCTVFYPRNDAAQTLARIAGTKTLTLVALRNAKILGLSVKLLGTPLPRDWANGFVFD